MAPTCFDIACEGIQYLQLRRLTYSHQAIFSTEVGICELGGYGRDVAASTRHDTSSGKLKGCWRGVPSLVQVQDDGVDTALVVVVSIHPVAVSCKVLSLLQGRRRKGVFVFAMASILHCPAISFARRARLPEARAGPQLPFDGAAVSNSQHVSTGPLRKSCSCRCPDIFLFEE